MNHSPLSHAIFDHTFDGLYIVDNNRCIQDWNSAAEAISGYSEQQMIGHRCSENFLVHVDEAGTSLCGEHCPLQATIDDGHSREARVYLLHREGHRLPVNIRTQAIHDDQGQVVGAIEIFRGVSSAEELGTRMAELERLAFIDKLTGLPNRRFADNRLELLFSQFKTSKVTFSALLIDLDHFKHVNDTYGHSAGDGVLQAVSQSLANGLRSSDLVARWGGEEFIVLSGGSDWQSLQNLAERCRMLIATTAARLDCGEIKITGSVGATSITAGDDLGAMIERMDQALYASKRNGRNRATLARS